MANKALAATALKLAKRNSSGREQYYTRPKIAEQCVAVAVPYVQNLPIIEPKHPQVVMQDFFSFFTNKPAFVIGNPPFGRNNALSVRFFNHAANFAEYIAFIVPKSWRKWSVQNRLNVRFHLVKDVALPKDIFYGENGNGFGTNFNAVFQIWQRKSFPRKKVIVEDRGYVKKCPPELANVALTYAGYASGKVETEFECKPNTTKIFLQADAYVIEALRQLDYSQINSNSAYTPVFGLREVIYLLNKYFDKTQHA